MSGVPGVTADTRLYGIFGHPVRHSLSPRMQTAAFAALGIDACYLAFEVPPEAFEAAFVGAARMGLGGLNVTVPHKRLALALAAERDATAEHIGAANTFVPAPDGWKAYNTDAAGFVAAVREELGFEPAVSRAAVLGAGGAARAAVAGLADAGGKEIWVTNRNVQRAEVLADEFSRRFPGVEIRAAALEELPERLAPGDLVTSATPLGLQAQGCWPWDPARFAPGVLFHDMAYAEAGTPLERQARQAGFRAVSGLGMLLRQGAESFRLWTGRQAPLDAMRRALGPSVS